MPLATFSGSSAESTGLGAADTMVTITIKSIKELHRKQQKLQNRSL